MPPKIRFGSGQHKNPTRPVPAKPVSQPSQQNTQSTTNQK